MRNLLRQLGSLGKTIIVSSHILPELADVCNKIGIIDRGVMNISASMSDVMRQVRHYVQLRIRVAGNSTDAGNLLRNHADVQDVEVRDDELCVKLKAGVTDHSALAELLVKQGFRLLMYREDELDLEAAFMALTREMGTTVSRRKSPREDSAVHRGPRRRKDDLGIPLHDTGAECRLLGIVDRGASAPSGGRLRISWRGDSQVAAEYPDSGWSGRHDARPRRAWPRDL
jgi:hypothetical protein